MALLHVIQMSQVFAELLVRLSANLSLLESLGTGIKKLLRCPFIIGSCAKRKRRYFGYSERAILRFFAPQGRHVAPMG